MNNEDRIVELLAESLRNQDIQSEKLETVSGKLDALVEVVKEMAKALQQQTSIMEKLITKYDRLEELEHRISLLERRSAT